MTFCFSTLADTVKLDRLQYEKITSGWKSAMAGKSVDGNTIKLNGKSFSSGIGTHAFSACLIKLDGHAERFTAIVGVDDETGGGNGSVVFIVRDNRKELFRSPIMKGGDKPLNVDINLKGVEYLHLLVNDGGNGIGFDHADWADAAIHYTGKKPEVIVYQTPEQIELNKPATYMPNFSTAGFFQTDAQIREAANFNIGWRFMKGDHPGAEKPDFNDSSWELVNTPHGLELVPPDASGCVNYQGPAWYRKKFRADKDWKNRKVFIHFESIMGRSSIYINGKLIQEQFGGYLPVHLDITGEIDFEKENVIAVRADNSDDPIYPPGKPQGTLDFVYFGGIYRDVFLVTTGKVYITNPNAVDKTAGGGVFVHFENLSEKQVSVSVNTDIRNESDKDIQTSLELKLIDQSNETVGKSVQSLLLKAGHDAVSKQELTVKKPHLWHVDDPYLHRLFVTLKDGNGKALDTFYCRVGIRKFEFRGPEGFFLNNKPFNDKLIGGNRHQDFACLGNAVPNTLQWRDAQKLRNASMRIIRSAHYPMDPAFMDACDELGLFVIVATPGWQFWNEAPVFRERVVQNIRNMVRRDRNHASVLMWEPILNETWYPPDFAKTVRDTVHEEFPYPDCYTACDQQAKGQEHFEIIYAHPLPDNFFKENNEKRPVFTREWGDCVDNWNSHNSPSRAAKGWGEAAQLVQAMHYSKPDYNYSTYMDAIYRTPKQHIGGCLWHPFDHQRGYHPDPFWGGILDAFRQPKYSYYMFKSQMPIGLNIPNVESRPFVFIANEMTPFSDKDVTVFSNCEEVRLKIYGKTVGTKSTHPEGTYMPHAPVVFKDIFDFLDVKQLHRSQKENQARIEVEGIVDGKVAVTAVKSSSLRRSRISLRADYSGAAFIADGSDVLTVTATFTDQDGNPKRLTDEYVRFEIEGPAVLINDAISGMNPQKSEWGEAVALIRASDTPGDITVRASVLKEGEHQPDAAELVITSFPSKQKFIFSEKPAAQSVNRSFSEPKESDQIKILREKLDKVTEELNALRLKEVERQQQEFEGKETGGQ